MSEDATKPLEAEVGSLNSKIKKAQDGIKQAKQHVKELEEDIDGREL